MQAERDEAFLTDLADGTLAGDEWDSWLAQHPDLAAEVEIARRVRRLVGELSLMDVTLPAGFEARLLARVHEDRTLLDLFDLGLGGLGFALLELLGTVFGALPIQRRVTQGADA